MQQTVKNLLLIWVCIYACGIPVKSLAAPYTPVDENAVVASWQVLDSKKEVIDLNMVREFIEQGQYPGESDYRYGRAKIWLEARLNQNQNVSAELFYLYARVLQHQHQFDTALKYLDDAIALNPEDINSWLLKANIHMVQGDHSLAKQACLAMLGRANIIVLTACALDVASQDGQLDDSYKELTRLFQSQTFADIPEKQWIVQMLADMALRKNIPAAANTHLKSIDLTAAPVSVISLWADTQLALLKHDQVLILLASIVKAHPIQDDALLLRLAIAEKEYPQQSYWQTIFAQRVALRELRNDSLHAAELARYYVDVNVQPEKALHWAKINWQVAQQHSDRKLLDQAAELWRRNQGG
ncbi:MAG: tetratricopeptide (TPR) repeat protein [Pseudohongiellaceae bacterium]|jgi:tetratricopeptide (TPR) repeat protein